MKYADKAIIAYLLSELEIISLNEIITKEMKLDLWNYKESRKCTIVETVCEQILTFIKILTDNLEIEITEELYQKVNEIKELLEHNSAEDLYNAYYISLELVNSDKYHPPMDFRLMYKIVFYGPLLLPPFVGILRVFKDIFLNY